MTSRWNIRRWRRLLRFSSKVLFDRGINGRSWLPARPSTVKAWVTIRKCSLLSFERLRALYTFGKMVESRGIPGDIVECGVYKGGSAGALALGTCADRRLWLFDSFQGLPKGTGEDGDCAKGRAGTLRSNIADVHQVMQQLGVPQSRVNVVPGWFTDTFASVDIGEVAILHLDADLYESTLLALDRFYDHLSPGGVLVIDDYGSKWEGCRRAVERFFERRGIEPRLTATDGESYWMMK